MALSIESEKDFSRGFMFALILAKSMGRNLPFDDIVAQLKLLANGDVTLMGTPEETIRQIELEFQKALPEVLKDSVRDMMSNRKKRDAENQAAAILMLRMMGASGDGSKP
jgi:hypothetical protein